jgi:hypothetical protein
LKLTADDRPEGVAFEFSTPLEDSTLMWLKWDDEHFIRFSPPAVGSTILSPNSTVALKKCETIG